MTLLAQPQDCMHPYIGNSVISLSFGAQFVAEGCELVIPERRCFLDVLCELPFRRRTLEPAHCFQEDYLAHDNLERFTELMRSSSEGSSVAFNGFFQKASAFKVALSSLLPRFFPIRTKWYRKAQRLLQRHDVDLTTDLIVNIRGREYKQVWRGANYFGVEWAEAAIERFPDARRVFLVSDDDDVPSLVNGSTVERLSRRHNPYVDFVLLSEACNIVIPKSSFSFIAVLHSAHPKRVLYPDVWLTDDTYSFQMVEMLDESPFVEKVKLPGY